MGYEGGYNAALSRFWGCTFYPNLTHDFRESRLPDKNRTFLLGNQIDTSVSASVNVTSALSTCLLAWCEGSKGCDIPSCTLNQLTINGTMLSAADVDNCLDNICQASPEKLSNPDIFGIGVSCSIMIQFGIAFGGLLSLIVCWILRTWRMKKSERIQSVMDIIEIALDEFQHAQCCFAIAIDIAALITLYNNEQQMNEIDKTMIESSGAAGIIPTTLVLATLMGVVNQNSPFTFLLTFFTWILSLIVCFIPKGLYHDNLIIQSVHTHPVACGMRASVYICEYQIVHFYGLDSFAVPAVFAMAILTFSQLLLLIQVIRFLNAHAVLSPNKRIDLARTREPQVRNSPVKLSFNPLRLWPALYLVRD